MDNKFYIQNEYVNQIEVSKSKFISILKPLESLDDIDDILNDINRFISYLSCALNTLIYHVDPSIILNNNQMILTSTTAFAKLCTNIIDYMRIGGVDNIRTKVLYLSSLYYQIGILLKDDNDSAEQKAKKISGISSRDAELLRVICPPFQIAPP